MCSAVRAKQCYLPSDVIHEIYNSYVTIPIVLYGRSLPRQTFTGKTNLSNSCPLYLWSVLADFGVFLHQSTTHKKQEVYLLVCICECMLCQKREWGRWGWLGMMVCIICNRRASASAYWRTPWHSSRARNLLSTEIKWAGMRGLVLLIFLVSETEHDEKWHLVWFLEETELVFSMW